MLSSWCPRASTASVGCPWRTAVTWPTPKRWPTRATHERTFCATTRGLVDPLEFAEAPVARVAGSAAPGFAEVLDERPVTAVCGRRVALDVAEMLAVCVAQLAVLFEQRFPAEEVGGRGDEDALGRQPVAARPSGLLLVMLERARRAGVQDEPHVRAIDPHAERDRRDHDVGALVEEGVLVGVTRPVVEPRVIGQGPDAGRPAATRRWRPPRGARGSTRCRPRRRGAR